MQINCCWRHTTRFPNTQIYWKSILKWSWICGTIFFPDIAIMRIVACFSADNCFIGGKDLRNKANIVFVLIYVYRISARVASSFTRVYKISILFGTIYLVSIVRAITLRIILSSGWLLPGKGYKFCCFSIIST